MPVATRRAEEIEQRCGSDEHQGVCAEVSAFRYADADELLDDPTPLIVALDQVQDPQNLGAICRTRRMRRRHRGRDPRAPLGGGDAGRLQGLGGRRRAPAGRAGPQPGRLPAPTPRRAGAWCYGADADGRLAYDAVDYDGPVVLVLGSEGRGLRPRVAAACDALVSIPLRGRIESLSVERGRGAVLLVRGRSRDAASAEPLQMLDIRTVRCYVKLAPGDKDQLEL